MKVGGLYKTLCNLSVTEKPRLEIPKNEIVLLLKDNGLKLEEGYLYRHDIVVLWKDKICKMFFWRVLKDDLELESAFKLL